MAQRLTAPGDTGAFDKVNGLIDEHNNLAGLIGGKAEQSALAAETEARELGDRSAISLVASDGSRPGLSPQMFTALLSHTDGLPAPLANPVTEAVEGIGRALVLPGQGDVASLRVIPLRAGVPVQLFWDVQRKTASGDPAGDTVEFRAAFLNAAGAIVSNTWVAHAAALAAGQRFTRTAVIADVEAVGTDRVWPATAVSVVPFVRTYNIATQTWVYEISGTKLGSTLSTEQIAILTLGLQQAQAAVSQSLANRSATAEDRAAAAASATAAAASANASSANAGTAGNFDTRAQAVSALGTIPENGGVNVLNDPATPTNPPDGTGVGNGFYVKQAGALVKKSNFTLAGIGQIISFPAAFAASGIAAAPRALDFGKDLVAGDQFGVRRASDGAYLHFTKSALETWIQEVALADRSPFFFDASGRYGKTAAVAVAEATDGGGIGVLSFKNESKTAFITIAFGRDAVIGGDGCYTLGPGAGYTFEKVPPGRVSIISDTDDTPATIHFWRSIKSDPNAVAAANRHIARYTGTLTQAQQTAIRNLYVALHESGWIKLCASGGSIWVGRAGVLADALLNWSGNNSFTTMVATGSGAAAPTVSFGGTVFDGNNAINTGVLPPLAALPKHSMFVWSDTLSGASGSRVATGNSVLRVAPNRSSTTTTLYTGAGSSIVTVGGQGGLQGYRRDNADNFQVFRNGVSQGTTAKTVNETTGGSRPVLIGALNGSSDLTSGYQGMLEAQVQTYGVTPTDAQIVQLYDALNAFRTAVGA